MSAREPLFTVAVCTYNRARLLGLLLEDLCAQTLPSEDYEILVVDNNSSDATPGVAEAFAARGVRRTVETAQGLSHARNRAWREARGRWVAYCDDDCRVPPGWLEAARDVDREHAPQAMGGPYFACYDSDKPSWYKDSYGSHEQGGARFLGPGEYLDGGNMFWLREVLEDLGGFDPDLGMKGGAVAYGEETDLLVRLRRERPEARVYYAPELWVRHLVSARRMLLKDFVRQRLADGASFERIRMNGGRPGAFRAAASLARAVLRLVLGLAALPLRDRTVHPRWQNALYEDTGPLWRALGASAARLRSSLRGGR